MHLTINIDTDNAAFIDNSSELQSLLETAVQWVVDTGGLPGSRALLDINGNTVGEVKIKEPFRTELITMVKDEPADEEPCSACGSTDWQPLGRLGYFEWRRCRDCGANGKDPSQRRL